MAMSECQVWNAPPEFKMSYVPLYLHVGRSSERNFVTSSWSEVPAVCETLLAELYMC